MTGFQPYYAKNRHEALRQHQLLREALLLWFDDHLGSMLESFCARWLGKRDRPTNGLATRSILKLDQARFPFTPRPAFPI